MKTIESAKFYRANGSVVEVEQINSGVLFNGVVTGYYGTNTFKANSVPHGAIIVDCAERGTIWFSTKTGLQYNCKNKEFKVIS